MSSNTNSNTYIELTTAATVPVWRCQKIYLLTKKQKKSALNEKVCFFVFSHFNNFFVTHGHIPAIFNVLDLILSELSHNLSPQHSQTYIQSLKPKQKLILYYGKVKETYFNSVKKAKHLSF